MELTENKVEFFPMSHRPKYSDDDPSFSTVVLVYEKDFMKNDHADLGYFDFELDQWNVLGGDSMKLVCWCYIPDPTEYMVNNIKKLKPVTHKGYRD